MRSKTPTTGDDAAGSLISGERDSATTLSPSELAHLRRLAQLHDTGRSTEDTDAESERGAGSPPTIPIIIADDGGHNDERTTATLIGNISPELYPAWARVAQSHKLSPDYNIGENNNLEKGLDYKSFRRRSIAIERLRDDQETKALVDMLATDPRQFARNSWPNQSAVRTDGRRREDMSPTEFARSQSTQEGSGKPLKAYRRGSVTDNASNGTVRKRSTKHRQPSVSDELDFDEAFAAYQNRERRRKSSYVKVMRQEENISTHTNVLTVTAVIFVALVIVMLIAAHLRKSQEPWDWTLIMSVKWSPL